MMKKPKVLPIPKFDWKCDGRIHPLIRSCEELRDCCVTEAEYLEASRIIKIELFGQQAAFETASSSDDELYKQYFQRSHHARNCRVVRGPLVPATGTTPALWTPAQFLAKHGNTECRAICDDLEDLLQCFLLAAPRLRSRYRDVQQHFRSFNEVSYHGHFLSDTGSDLFHYVFGWEGPLVVYISYDSSCSWALLSDWRHYRQYTPDMFVSACQRLAKAAGAGKSELLDDPKIIGWRLVLE